jgi:hypothetical protein
MPVLDSTRTIQGHFGEVWKDGVWLTNIYKAEATGDMTYDKIKRSGTRRTGNKLGGIEYSGSIGGYKVTTEFAEQIAQAKDDKRGAFVCELIIALKDPEAYGYERVRLKGVQFTKMDIIKFEVGSVVEQENPFVFDDWEHLDKITS